MFIVHPLEFPIAVRIWNASSDIGRLLIAVQLAEEFSPGDELMPRPLDLPALVDLSTSDGDAALPRTAQVAVDESIA